VIGTHFGKTEGVQDIVHLTENFSSKIKHYSKACWKWRDCHEPL